MPVAAGCFQCKGAEKKLNWLITRVVPAATRCIVFFPGDISDFANAQAPYHYSLEALTWVLAAKYPDDTLVVVKPRMMVELFAVYVNFMFVDSTGNPRPRQRRRSPGSTGADEEDVVPAPPAAAHLEGLLQSLEEQLEEAVPRTLVLVGFSKGAAVLNALLLDARESSFWSRCEAIHFIDAGLTVPGVFPATREDLKELAKNVPQGFAIWLHFTPRQSQDEARPFVAEEAETFAERCKVAGLAIQRRDYFSQQLPSLDMHFDCLRCFQTSLDDEDDGDKHAGFFKAWGEKCA
mmetsp:Transcript_28587/g.66238  ORF Transcript_28587/g.66238 Transcript_28587/m.66238 type:complete len:292 (+) Transcript_28587:82-957(+)